MPSTGGIHGPYSFTFEEFRYHQQYCLKERLVRIKHEIDGSQRLHDALDLADRTARRRGNQSSPTTPQKAPKKVRFALDTTEARHVNYTATDPFFKSRRRANDRQVTYCNAEFCICLVSKLYPGPREHRDYRDDCGNFTCGEEGCCCQKSARFFTREAHEYWAERLFRCTKLYCSCNPGAIYINRRDHDRYAAECFREGIQHEGRQKFNVVNEEDGEEDDEEDDEEGDEEEEEEDDDDDNDDDVITTVRE